MALTQKQEAFCLAYIKTGNASEAYRGSYSASKMTDKQVWEEASKLKNSPKVDQRISELRAMAQSAAIMTREQALERLTRMACVQITDVAEFSEQVIGEDDNGQPVKQTVWRIKNSDELSPEAAASIKSITATKFGPKLEMHDPQSAIQQIAKLQGWEAPQKIDAQVTVKERVQFVPAKMDDDNAETS